MTKVEPIRLVNKETGVEYVLEFNRNSVKRAEKAGFTLSDISSGKIISGYSELFYYAFLMHHPYMKQADTDRILFEELGGISDALQTRLIELFAEPYNALVEAKEEGGEKNSKWSVTL